MSQQKEPWWTKDDRAFLERLKKVVEGKADTDRVWYIGDQRGAELVSSVKQKIKELEERIPADIKRYNDAGCDYEKM